MPTNSTLRVVTKSREVLIVPTPLCSSARCWGVLAWMELCKERPGQVAAFDQIGETRAN